jgi:hypothetical protein
MGCADHGHIRNRRNEMEGMVMKDLLNKLARLKADLTQLVAELTEPPVAWLGITITKPRRMEFAEHWQDDCNGRLILGTGCGHCLRCNREWFAILRSLPAPYTGVPHHDIPQEITLTDDQRKQLIAKFTMTAEAVPQKTIYDHRKLTPMQLLEAWVKRYNDALVRNDTGEINSLDVQLRTLVFPDGVELVDEPHGDGVIVWLKEIVYSDMTAKFPQVVGIPMAYFQLGEEENTRTYEYREFRGQGKTKQESEQNYTKEVNEYLKNFTSGTIYWRVKPETEFFNDFRTEGKVWRKYSRFVVVPDDETPTT